MTVVDADPDDDDDRGTILIGLMQIDRRNEGKLILCIGYYIYKVWIICIYESLRVLGPRVYIVST